ncbi:MAG: hypothetical protein AAB037_06485 [Chloroflexota bacterium]
MPLVPISVYQHRLEVLGIKEKAPTTDTSVVGAWFGDLAVRCVSDEATTIDGVVGPGGDDLSQ